jgi:DNA-binding YbaB/EbfC family protein
MNDQPDDPGPDDDERAEVEVVDDGQGGDPLAALGLGDLGAAFGGGMPDLGSMMEGLSKVQELQEASYEGSAGGGLVRISANGRMEVESVTIAPEAVDPSDVELLADLVLAALRDLTTQINEAQRAAMGPLGNILGG